MHPQQTYSNSMNVQVSNADAIAVTTSYCTLSACLSHINAHLCFIHLKFLSLLSVAAVKNSVTMTVSCVCVTFLPNLASYARGLRAAADSRAASLSSVYLSVLWHSLQAQENEHVFCCEKHWQYLLCVRCENHSVSNARSHHTTCSADNLLLLRDLCIRS